MKDAFVIQDVQTGQYLKHDGTGEDHPYTDVAKVEDSTMWESRAHVAHVLWWYVDMHRPYRVIDLNTGEQFVKDTDRGIPHIKIEGERK